ncbi:phospholipase/carboxylesterase [Pseudoclavibacter endophyticus]|nr:phospholipase [Pseudoclavibacter endophyticus]GGA73041.1 phospholipase/carboxylesterase [Pseudoclavibacter endophyticus]
MTSDAHADHAGATAASGTSSPTDAVVLWSEPVAEGRPLVLLLHGYASNEADLFALAERLGDRDADGRDGAGRARPVFASLRAPGLSDTAFVGYAWFDLRVGRDGALLGAGDTDADREATADLDAGATRAAEHVIRWLDGVLASGPTPSSIGLVGFSQGGIVALQMLRMHPRRFAATVALGSMVAPGLHPGDEALAATRPPLFVGWGGHDEVIPQAATRFSLDWATETTTLTEYGEPGAGHEVTPAQLDAVTRFLAENLT